MRHSIFFLAAVLLIFIHCGTASTNHAPDLKPLMADMTTAPQPDLLLAPVLVSASPATIAIGADATITVKGSACHFDTWCSVAAATSFAPCVLNSFSTKVVDADTVQYLISVPAGAQPTACNVSIQPRVPNSGGGCGANAGPLLTLSPAFSLK